MSKVSVFHNVTTTKDGRLAIFDRPGKRRIKVRDELQLVGILDFPEAIYPTAAADLAFEAGNSPADIDAVNEYRSWVVRSLSVGDVLAIEDDDHHVVTLECRSDGWGSGELAHFKLVGAAVVSLRIENAYELYEDVETTVTDVVIPLPPEDTDSEEYELWLDNHIRCYMGVGHTDGDSWYDVEITASSDPALVGRKFDWGY